MCGLDVYKVSRRAFAAGHCGPPRTVPLCVHGRREGHFYVCQRGVHVRSTSGGRRPPVGRGHVEGAWDTAGSVHRGEGGPVDDCERVSSLTHA